jgi:hypothetical protein
MNNKENYRLGGSFSCQIRITSLFFLLQYNNYIDEYADVVNASADFNKIVLVLVPK